MSAVAAQGVAPVLGRAGVAGYMSEFERLVGEMEARVDALVDSTLERIGQRFPNWATGTAFSRDQVRRLTREAIQAQLHDFRRDTLPPECPPFAAVAARAVARVGELETFANGFRSAQAALWQAWFNLIEDSGLQGAARRDLLSRGSDFFFRYADLLTDYVTQVHGEEHSRLLSNGSQRRFSAVRSLLEGDPASAASIDFDLHRHHLGLIAWGEAGEKAARGLASILTRPLLLIAPLPGTCWGWISGTRPLAEVERRALSAFRPPERSGVALGLDEYGEQGFRTTHRQAQRARLLAPADDPSLTLYADIAVEALASENPQEARNFVAREIGPIDDDSTTSRRIRETLTAYFAAEHNAASAAASLGVHQQTVANRLRAAEERLGHPISARRVELELALRLRRSLGVQPSRPTYEP